MLKLDITRSSIKPTIRTRLFHRFQERIRHPQWRLRVARVLALAQPGARVDKSSVLVDELHREGIAVFPGFITTAEANDLRAALEQFKCFDPWRVGLGEFPHDQVPSGTHVAQIREAPRLARLHALANDSRVIDLVSAYFNCKPCLDSIQAWWSLSGNEEPEEAENFHRDNDAIRFLKLFIYATDVGEENGPHVYVAGSHKDPKLTARRRLADTEVEQAFGPKAIRVMTGQAGDAFLEDTFGIHKGQLPRTGRRLLIQFRYSVTETVFRSPIAVAKPYDGASPRTTSLLHVD